MVLFCWKALYLKKVIFSRFDKLDCKADLLALVCYVDSYFPSQRLYILSFVCSVRSAGGCLIRIAPVKANKSSNFLVQKPEEKYSLWMWQHVCGISVEIPALHLEFAARRGQHVLFFPKLTQKHMSHTCLIPANKDLQLSVTVGKHYMQVLQEMEDSSLRPKEN